MSNAQARLIASGLALIAAAIFIHAQPDARAAPWALALSLLLFVWEYSRPLVPERGQQSRSGTPPGG